MEKRTFIIASILGGLVVVIGAYGAHGLKPLLTQDQFNSFETAVRYQFYHCFVLLIISICVLKNSNLYLKYATLSYLIGIVLFSGSIYLLATKNLHGLPVSWAGPLTPIGGLFLVLGWILLTIYGFKKVNN